MPPPTANRRSDWCQERPLGPPETTTRQRKSRNVPPAPIFSRIVRRPDPRLSTRESFHWSGRGTESSNECRRRSERFYVGTCSAGDRNRQQRLRLSPGAVLLPCFAARALCFSGRAQS